VFRISVFVLIATPLLAQDQGIGEVLYPAIGEHGIAAAVEKYHQLRETEAGRLDMSEQQLNALGYRLLSERRIDAAIAIFALNAEVYPESANVYDSLAEAHAKNGDKARAEKLYGKALAILEHADPDDQNAQALELNATRQLRLLQKPQREGLPEAVTAFLNRGEHPFGKSNPDAPAETAQFGQLAGLWKITNHSLYQGRWYSGFDAYWVWKYSMDGFGVLDLWFQPDENQPPVNPLPRDLQFTQMRTYDPSTGQWWIGFSSNKGSQAAAPVSGAYDGVMEEGGELVMTPRGAQTGKPTRIVFSEMKPTSFKWRFETQQEDGSWLCVSKMDAVRADHLIEDSKPGSINASTDSR